MLSRLIVGSLVALSVALVMSGASILGVEAWKILLAVAGFLLFRSARR